LDVSAAGGFIDRKFVSLQNERNRKKEENAMYIIRNVFKCKPGQAKKLIEHFQKSMGLMEEVNYRILVDYVADFWTVVLETETEDITGYEKQLSEYGARPDVQEAMSGYMDSVESGYREIFRIV